MLVQKGNRSFQLPQPDCKYIANKGVLCGWLVGFCLCVWFGLFVVLGCWFFSNPVDTFLKLSRKFQNRNESTKQQCLSFTDDETKAERERDRLNDKFPKTTWSVAG